jgi:hypothetical protein
MQVEHSKRPRYGKWVLRKGAGVPSAVCDGPGMTYVQEQQPGEGTPSKEECLHPNKGTRGIKEYD